MSDKKKSELSVMPEFVSGEQPTAAKFNAIGSLIKRESFVLEKSIGDIWGESEPYSVYSNALLSIPIFQSTMKNIIPNSSDVNGRSLDIASLGRAIGPMSKLNPKILTDGLNVVVSQEYSDTSIVRETVTSNPGYQYSLRYLPANGSSFSFSDTSVFSNEKSIYSIETDGDYAIDRDKGILYTFNEMVAGSTIEYSVRPIEWSGGPSYNGSSFNTIPDINQVGLNDLVISQPIGGIYEITFPEISFQTSNFNETSSSLDLNDVNYLGKYKLPAAITAVCGGDYTTGQQGIVDSLIPEGMIYLKNAVTGEIYSDGIYYYNNDHSIKVENVTLDLADTYYLVTTGTDITSSIEDLGKKQFKHSHSREFGEPLISVKDLDEIYDEKAESGSYGVSSIPGNYFSQYIHRDGFTEDQQFLNDNNCMRGDFLIGKANASAGDFLTAGDSHKIIFGYDQSALEYGPSIYNNKDGSINWLTIESKDTYNTESKILLDSSHGISCLAEDKEIELITSNGRIEITSDGGEIDLTSNTHSVVLDARGNGHNIAEHGMVMRHRSSATPINASTGWHHPRVKCIVYESSQDGDIFMGKDYPGGTNQSNGNSVNVVEAEVDISGKIPNSAVVLGYQCLVSSDDFEPRADSLQQFVANNWAGGSIGGDHWIPIDGNHPRMSLWGFLNTSWSLFGQAIAWILQAFGAGMLASGPSNVGGIAYKENLKTFYINVGVDFFGGLGQMGPSHFPGTSHLQDDSNGNKFCKIRTRIIVWYK